MDRNGDGGGLPFAVYVRVSKVNGREGDRYISPEVQEAACREHAERLDLDVVPEPATVDENVSGSKPAEKRLLGQLIRRVEEGELAGVIVRDLSRFGRSVESGAIAVKRLMDAGGRLIAVQDGIDTANPGAKLQLNILFSIAEDYLDRVKENFIASQERAAARGAYLAARPPLGYDRKIPEGTLEPNDDFALVREAFERRAAGEPVKSIARWLRGRGVEISVSGMYKVLQNRAYLGEMTVQTKGGPATVTGQHEPAVTERLFERVLAQAGRYEPRTGAISSRTHLLGIARCASCGQNLHGSAAGPPARRRAYYACTGPRPCPRRASVSADALNDHVWQLLERALESGHPGVAAAVEGGDEYGAAETALAEAKEERALYVELTSIRAVGREAYERGLAARDAAIELARRELRGLRPPTEEGGAMFGLALRADGTVADTLAPVDDDARRAALRLLVRRVEVAPSARSGPRPRVEDRARVWLAGDESPTSDGFGRVAVTARLKSVTARLK